MEKTKYYFFRELSHQDNFDGLCSFHAAGIVYAINAKNSISGKDISVGYFNPFDGSPTSGWLATNEVELFEVSSREWHDLKKRLL